MARGGNRFVLFMVSLAALPTAIGNAAADDLAVGAAPTDQLQEIVVTAERRPEKARDVPVAVSIVDPTLLTALNSSGADIRSLAAAVPSLEVESSFGRTYPRFYIRGLGNSDFDLTAQQPVSVVYDDIALENAILKAFPVFDVDQVEVLRGPQGTLFGRNTPAGVVKIDSQKPSDQFDGVADLSYGSFNAVDATVAEGGPIVLHKLDFRASIQEERQDGWVTNSFDQQAEEGAPTYGTRHLEGYNDLAGRLQLLYRPDDDISLLFNAHFRTLDGTARVFRANIIEKGTNDLVPGFSVFRVAQDGDNMQTLDTQGADVTAKVALGAFELTSVSAYDHGTVYSRGDIDGGYGAVYLPVMGPGVIPFTSETSDRIPNLYQMSQELRLATTGDGRFFNQGGLYAFHSFLRTDDFDFTPAGVVDIRTHQQLTDTSLGVFDQPSYQVTDALKLTAGIRLSSESKRYEAWRDFGYDGPLRRATTALGSNISWNASATYAVADNASLYARVATGYLAPSVEGRIEFADNISKARAENTISYEAGVKSTLLDRKARFNLTAYAYTTHDMQLTAIGGTGNVTQLVNADRAVGRGVEAEFEVKPIHSLKFTASSSYNFTAIEDPNVAVSPCGDGCTVLNPLNAAGNALLNGNPLPMAPRWIVDATARYAIPAGSEGEVFVYTDWSYRSSIDLLLYRSIEFTGQPLILGGVRIGYDNYEKDYQLAFFVRNVLDQVKVIGAIDFDNLEGMVNDPRTFGVEASIRF